MNATLDMQHSRTETAATDFRGRGNLTAVEAETILRRQDSNGEKIPPGPPPTIGAAKKRPSQAFYNSPYSASRLRHHVNFFCDAPNAGHVCLVGDFNGWDIAATPMIPMPNGYWMIGLELPHGHHQYLFLVDGQPMLDPKAMGRARNECNELVSLIAVS
jgi:hypothetical protein